MESQAPAAEEAVEPIQEDGADVRPQLEEGDAFDDASQRWADLYATSEQALGTMREQSRAINDAAVSFIRQRPVVALGVALGVGYVIGRLARSRMII